MLDPQTCMQYGFCDVIDDFKAEEDDEDEDDNKDEIIQELRNQLFRQQEMNRMMQSAGMQPGQNQEPPADSRAEAAKRIRETLMAAMTATR